MTRSDDGTERTHPSSVPRAAGRAISPEWRHRVETWIAADPDPDTRAELADLLDRGELAELEDRFAEPLTFGTAGLRGRLGAGPARMNRLVVRRTSAGLARWLLDGGVEAPSSARGAGSESRTTRTGIEIGHRQTAKGADGIVVGHDARHGSEAMAAEAARTVAAAGIRARVLSRPLPTPLVAFAVRHLGAVAGVMITASHNPAPDNGYKVYLADGAQVVPPYDAAITAAAAAAMAGEQSPFPTSRSSRTDPSSPGSPPSSTPPSSTPPSGLPAHRVEALDESELLDAYRAVALGLLDDSAPRRVAAVYTPLHGVGGAVLPALVEAAGFPPLRVVASQAEPDPDFPTVPFPNPEEAGVLDRALALAKGHDTDIVIANDPDADRLAVAVPTSDGGWRALSGDEVGILLGDRLLSRSSGPDRLVAASIVSSTMLSSLAAQVGATYVETLTGFKWIARAAAAHQGYRLLFGYEEALGYAVTDAVADKDGMTAALMMLELAAIARADGRRLQDRLDELSALLGVHQTAQWSRRFAGRDAPGEMRRVMSSWRQEPPNALGGLAVTEVVDLARGGGSLPPSDVVVLRLGDVARVVLRPSGTEPKLKVYMQATTEPPGLSGVEAARMHAAAVITAVQRDVVARC